VFDRKKLEAILDSLEVSTHFPSEAPSGIIAPPRSALDEEMDKYDIFKQGDYENVGSAAFPIWPFWASPIYPTYGGILRGSYAPGADPGVAPLTETPYAKLGRKIKKLKCVNAAKIADPEPLEPAKSPDYVHTITAWRGWNIDNGRLAALGSDATWRPKKAEQADCRDHNHPAPQMKCACGYWSFKKFEDMVKVLEGYANNVKVVGTVEIWGRVIECTNGFRSEFAYPKELWLLEEGLESLSWAYGVPVRKMESV
jgi:hypothetical protein